MRCHNSEIWSEKKPIANNVARHSMWLLGASFVVTQYVSTVRGGYTAWKLEDGGMDNADWQRLL